MKELMIQKKMLNQYYDNMQIQSELDELRDEVSCCYEHFEEYKKIEDNGR